MDSLHSLLGLSKTNSICSHFWTPQWYFWGLEPPSLRLGRLEQGKMPTKAASDLCFVVLLLQKQWFVVVRKSWVSPKMWICICIYMYIRNYTYTCNYMYIFDHIWTSIREATMGMASNNRVFFSVNIGLYKSHRKMGKIQDTWIKTGQFTDQKWSWEKTSDGYSDKIWWNPPVNYQFAIENDHKK